MYVIPPPPPSSLLLLEVDERSFFFLDRASVPLLEAGAESAAATALAASMVLSFLCGVCLPLAFGAVWSGRRQAKVPAKSPNDFY